LGPELTDIVDIQVSLFKGRLSKQCAYVPHHLGGIIAIVDDPFRGSLPRGLHLVALRTTNVCMPGRSLPPR
jgi:hypothetical protein